VIIKKFIFKTSFAFLRVLLVFSLIFVFWGCAAFDKEKTVKIPSDTHEWKTFINGYEAFEQKNYANAADVFAYLYKLDKNSRISRLALYGLACAQMAMAEDARAFKDALLLWHHWADSFPRDLDVEDPRMFEPLLMRLEASLQESSRLKDKENKIQSLNAKIEAMKKAMDKLERQINELEAIDQKILNKKKEISSPQ